MAENTTLYCGNLSYATSEAELQDAFSRFGTIKNVSILRDRDGRSKGTAFVELSNASECHAAIKDMDSQNFNGRNIRVNMSRGPGNREDGGDRPPRRQGGDRSCYTCGDSGHMSYDCPSGDGGQQRTFRRGGGGGGYGGRGGGGGGYGGGGYGGGGY